MRNRLWPVALCLLALLLPGPASSAAAEGVRLIDQSVVTDEGLYFWYPNGKKAYHYAPNISPRGDCFAVAGGHVFFGWYRGGMTERDLMISRKKIGSGEWVTVQLPHKNTLIGRAASWGESHNTIAVDVSTKDGTIHIFYDHHNDPLKYIVSKPGGAFAPDEDFTIDLFEPTRGYLAKGEPIRITYPHVTKIGDGELLVNYRRGSAIGGNEIMHRYNGSTWSRALQVTRGAAPHIPDDMRNYAYGSAPVAVGDDVYYAFSVRWKRQKADGRANQGLYLAKWDVNETGTWEDPWGKKHKLPIEDYAPFQVADPPTDNQRGIGRGPQLTVSEAGAVAINFSGNGPAERNKYVVTRAPGERRFTVTPGSARLGDFWGERLYSVQRSKGRITLQSRRVNDPSWTDELSLETGITFGNAVTEVKDGVLVMIAEDRTIPNTDKQKIHCFVFELPRAAR